MLSERGVFLMKGFIVWIKKVLFGSLSIILFLLIWEVASRTGLVLKSVIPPPSLILEAIIKSAQSGELLMHMLGSLKRSATGFILAIVIAIPTGFLLGTFFKTIEKIFLPFFRMLEKLNPFAIFPVFMIIFGIGNFEKIAVIFWVAQWPLLFYTIAGTKSVDFYLLKSARSMGANRKRLFLDVILPSAVPSIFTGIKISAQISFFMIIASEIIGSTEGLGWYFLSANQAFQIPLMYGVIIVITVLSVIINVLFTNLERHFLSWKESPFQVN